MRWPQPPPSCSSRYRDSGDTAQKQGGSGCSRQPKRQLLRLQSKSASPQHQRLRLRVSGALPAATLRSWLGEARPRFFTGGGYSGQTWFENAQEHTKRVHVRDPLDMRTGEVFSRNKTIPMTERACSTMPELVKSDDVGGLDVAVRIETPFPSVHKVAKTLGVSAERVKEIERLIEERSKAERRAPVSNRRSGNRRRSARSRNGRRS